MDDILKHSLEGKILVASPYLEDLYFEKSVIYVVSHDENGAVGIILNHKIGSISSTDLFKFTSIKNKKLNKSKRFPVLFGGPINTDKFLALGLNREQEKIFDKEQKITLYTDTEALIKKLANGKLKEKVVLAKGLAVWETNQLEAELSENVWLVTQPSVELLFSQRKKKKWDALIKQMGLSHNSHIVPYTGNA